MKNHAHQVEGVALQHNHQALQEEEEGFLHTRLAPLVVEEGHHLDLLAHLYSNA